MATDLVASILQFSAAYAFILVIPGTVMVTTSGIAALQGLGAATTFVMGVAAGAGLTTASAGFAVNTFVSAMPAPVGQFGSGTLLLIVATVILRSSDRPQQANSWVTAGSAITLMLAGLATALTSPLTVMFATAMFSRPASSYAPLTVEAATLVVVVANFCWYGALAVVFSHPIARSTLLHHQRRFQIGCATLLICMGFFMLAQAGGEVLAQGTMFAN